MSKTHSNKTKNILVGTTLSGCLLILSFFAGISGSWLGNRMFASSGNGQTLSNVQIVNEDSAIIDVAAQAGPAVVSIVVTKDLPKLDNYDSLYEYYYGDGQSTGETEERQIGAGSGFLFSADGYILTNRHVVSDTAASYTVVLNDERRFEATVIGRDTVLDIAVLKIRADEALPFLLLGDSDQIKIGQRVIAIGNSLGEFSNTVSTGIVSGLSRSIIAGSGNDAEELTDVIQTDASINPGNSGGPLLDIQGNVIGVNVAIAQDAENIGFSIPINAVKKVVDSVLEFGEIVRPYLGVRYQIIDAELAELNKLPVDYGAWIIVATDGQESIITGSPAAKAGLKPGDIILEINGEQITNDNTLQTIVQKFNVGETVSVKYLRGEAEQSVQVTLDKRPAE